MSQYQTFLPPMIAEHLFLFTDSRMAETALQHRIASSLLLQS